MGNVIYEIPTRYANEEIWWAVGYTNRKFKKEVRVRNKYVVTVSLHMAFKAWNLIRSLEIGVS